VRFKRPPDSVILFPAVQLYEDSEGVVSLNILDPTESIIVNGLTLIDRGYLGVWHVSSSEWHDVGAIYDTAKTFTGYYSDVATPIKRLPNGYMMTDLFLDLWVFPDGKHLVLDQDEFDKAVAEGLLTNNQIRRAKAELGNLIRAVESKQFPPQKIRRLITLPENVEEIENALQKLQGTAQQRTLR